jgi:hypothetical protein
MRICITPEIPASWEEKKMGIGEMWFKTSWDKVSETLSRKQNANKRAGGMT